MVHTFNPLCLKIGYSLGKSFKKAMCRSSTNRGRDCLADVVVYLDLRVSEAVWSFFCHVTRYRVPPKVKADPMARVTRLDSFYTCHLIIQ